MVVWYGNGLESKNTTGEMDVCKEVNGEWIINGRHGMSRERRKNDAACSDESAVRCIQ